MKNILLLIFFTTPLFAMKKAKVVKGPYKDLIGKIASIEGTTEDILDEEINSLNLDISDLEMLPVVTNYITTKPPKTGTVYYGWVGGKDYCLHESWLGQMSEASDSEAPKESKTRLVKMEQGEVYGPPWLIDLLAQKKEKREPNSDT